MGHSASLPGRWESQLCLLISQVRKTQDEKKSRGKGGGRCRDRQRERMVVGDAGTKDCLGTITGCADWEMDWKGTLNGGRAFLFRITLGHWLCLGPRITLCRRSGVTADSSAEVPQPLSRSVSHAGYNWEVSRQNKLKQKQSRNQGQGSGMSPGQQARRGSFPGRKQKLEEWCTSLLSMKCIAMTIIPQKITREPVYCTLVIKILPTSHNCALCISFSLSSTVGNSHHTIDLLHTNLSPH